MSTCIFCKIISREIPSEILAENEYAISILDLNPIHYGHALIIPKNHHKDFLEVPGNEIGGIMSLTHAIAHALVKTYNLQGFNFFSNNGEIAGQSVFHFHIHVTPRYPNDDIHFQLSLKKYPDGLMKETAQRIKENISSIK